MSAISDLMLRDAIHRHLISLSVCSCAWWLCPLFGRLVEWFPSGCGGCVLLLSSASPCSMGFLSLLGWVVGWCAPGLSLAGVPYVFTRPILLGGFSCPLFVWPMFVSSSPGGVSWVSLVRLKVR